MEIGDLTSHFYNTRKKTEEICKPLTIEDHVAQPITDVSPPKWHLGHTSWFFEQFILLKYKQDYRLFNKDFNFIFNSYYNNKGEKILRNRRGDLTRPTVQSILEYREHIDKNMEELLSSNHSALKDILFLTELGINHEQQHQELLSTDLKYILGTNPLYPEYKKAPEAGSSEPVKDFTMLEMDEGIYNIGHDSGSFFYDNEKAPHKVFLHKYKIMDRLVTNREYLEFMEAGGYEDFNLWLSDGWDWVNENEVIAPLYWEKIDGKWHNFTLHGMVEVDPNAPVTHINYYEADAYARWAGKRLPTEFEWEAAVNKYEQDIPKEANLMENNIFNPIPKVNSNRQFFGDVWEWTGSAYLPYPHYRKDKGALGEYNAKFMVNQMVLRGGSCVTPRSHIRSTYRNFFQADKRWQFTGIRLAEYA